MSAHLSVSDVSWRPHKRTAPVLHTTSFEVAKGHVLGVVGPNGAGKSTLARALTGVWKPAGGTIRLDGAALDTATALDSIATGLGRIGDFTPIADSFITLVVVGLVLSMVRERSGNIIWAIAIHAGWVMIIKLAKYLTDTSYVDGKASFWVGEYDHITGWMATLWLGAIAAVYWVYTRPKD